MKKDFATYANQLQLEQLLKKLGADKPDTLANTIEHFTLREGERRDQIVRDYFGTNGTAQIVGTISSRLLESRGLPANATIIDVGAGSGFFTLKIAKKIRKTRPATSFYAMDLTPAMLLSLAKKKPDMTLFIGVAENIKGSITEARKFFHIPYKFDAAISTLVLHHSPQPERVFESVSQIIKKNGRVIILDLTEHPFREFKAEMGDVHLGFRQEAIRSMAEKHFRKVSVEKLPGIRCESSGRSAEIFVAVMKEPLSRKPVK